MKKTYIAYFMALLYAKFINTLTYYDKVHNIYYLLPLYGCIQ